MPNMTEYQQKLRTAFASITLPRPFDVLLFAKGLLALLGIWWIANKGQRAAAGSLVDSLLLSNIALLYIFTVYAAYRMSRALVKGQFSMKSAGARGFIRHYGIRTLAPYWAVTIMGAVLAGVVAKPLPPANEFIPKELFLLQWEYGYHVAWELWAAGTSIQFIPVCFLVMLGLTRSGHAKDIAIGAYLILLVALRITNKSLGIESIWTNNLVITLHFQAGILIALYEEDMRRAFKEASPNVLLRFWLGGLALVWLTTVQLTRAMSGIPRPFAVLFTDLIVAGILGLHWMGKERKWDLGPAARAVMVFGVLGIPAVAWARVARSYFPWIFEGDFLSTVIAGAAMAFSTCVLVEKPVINYLGKRAALNPDRTETGL